MQRPISSNEIPFLVRALVWLSQRLNLLLGLEYGQGGPGGEPGVTGPLGVGGAPALSGVGAPGEGAGTGDGAGALHKVVEPEEELPETILQELGRWMRRKHYR